MTARRRDGREVAQKGKGRKRGRWHRRHEVVELPETPEAAKADPTSGAPTPLVGRTGKRRRGPAL
jgi:hypothetical protein